MAFVLVPSLSLNALYDARIQLDAKMRQPVPGARAGPVSLDRYMQLPVEQYRSLVKLVVLAAVPLAQRPTGLQGRAWPAWAHSVALEPLRGAAQGADSTPFDHPDTVPSRCPCRHR